MFRPNAGSTLPFRDLHWSDPSFTPLLFPPWGGGGGVLRFHDLWGNIGLLLSFLEFVVILRALEKLLTTDLFLGCDQSPVMGDFWWEDL